MRWAHISLIALALVAGCSHQVASLVGLDDGGDAGGADGGICTDDSQCPDGSYCDFTLTFCPWDAGTSYEQRAVVNPGSCLPDCGDSCPTACHVAEDCAPRQLCILWIRRDGGDEGRSCTKEQPCSAGECGNAPCPPVPQGCPSVCALVRPAHDCLEGCVCPDNTCKAPEGDAGFVPVQPGSLTIAIGSTGIDVALAGSGLKEQPCFYSVTPASLNFGQVCPGPIVQDVIINNLGPNECLISLSLAASSPPICGLVLSATSDVTLRLSAPGSDSGYPSSITLPFELCAQPGPFDCTIQISANSALSPWTFSVAGTCCPAADGGG